MKPQTIGRDDYGSKSVPIQYVSEDVFDDLEIKDSCFLLTIVYDGEVCFKVGEAVVEAVGPCLICFDETSSPQLIHNRKAKCDSVYFSPLFLNVNMTFQTVHSESYPELAILHDMFLLKPFTDKKRYVFHIFDEQTVNIQRMFENLKSALDCQIDWYWSCRSRSYFMEIMLFLERLYGLNKQSDYASQIVLRNPQLKKAISYIESNYRDSITLNNIATAASINHSTLTKLFKSELSMSPIEYLWHHRLTVAKKFLEFTSLPLKEIAARCGFKTTEHFNRRFKMMFKTTPGTFRKTATGQRITAFKEPSTIG